MNPNQVVRTLSSQVLKTSKDSDTIILHPYTEMQVLLFIFQPMYICVLHLRQATFWSILFFRRPHLLPSLCPMYPHLTFLHITASSYHYLLMCLVKGSKQHPGSFVQLSLLLLQSLCEGHTNLPLILPDAMQSPLNGGATIHPHHALLQGQQPDTNPGKLHRPSETLLGP